MGKLKNYLFGAAAIALVVQTLAFTGAGQALADTVKATLVQVVNTSDQPVPIYAPGAIPVSGTITANIPAGAKIGIDPTSNTVKLDASGTPLPVSVSGGISASIPTGSKVGIDSASNTVKLDLAGTPVAVTGTVNTGNLPLDSNGNLKVANQETANVNVGNTASSPVLTRDVDNSARQPYADMLFLTVGPGTKSNSQGFTVPAGKRLVIEYVSGSVTVQPSSTQQPYVDFQTCTGNSGQQYYPPLSSRQAFGTMDLYFFSEPVHVYAYPAYINSFVTTLHFANNLDSGQNGYLQISLSGYLEDLP